MLVGWLPLALLAAMEGKLLGPTLAGSLAGDFALHARSGVAATLLVLAGGACFRRLEGVARHFVDSGIVPGPEVGRFHDAVASTRALCGSTAAAIAIVVLAYALAASLLTLAAAGTMPAWHVASGAPGFQLSLAGWWHVLVSLPLLLALLLGWLWRLWLWTRFLWRVSRLDLQLVPAHPDRAAGLMFLGYSVRAFNPAAFALGAIVAGSAVNGVLYAGEPLLRYRHEILVVAALVVAFFTGPVLVFAGRLSQARLRGALQYGALAQGVGQLFERKWLSRARARPLDREALGTGDFSAATDLYATVANVYAMRLVPVDMVGVASLAVAGLLPFAPVAVLALPLDTILAFLAGLLH